MLSSRIGLFPTLVLLVSGCGYDQGFNNSFLLPSDQDNHRLTVTFGRIPSETIISLLRIHAPLIEYLERQLKVDIQFPSTSNYDRILKGMADNSYDFVFFVPLHVRSIR